MRNWLQFFSGVKIFSFETPQIILYYIQIIPRARLCFHIPSCNMHPKNGFSSRSTPVSGVCWLFSVLHANLSVWVWMSYFVFSYNYCWEEIVSLKCPDCSTVACTGGIFLGEYYYKLACRSV